MLYEELQQCSFPNNLSPGDTVGAITFIKDLEEHISGDIEVVTVRTLGLKNCDVVRALCGKDLPMEVSCCKAHNLEGDSLKYNSI